MKYLNENLAEYLREHPQTLGNSLYGSTTYATDLPKIGRSTGGGTWSYTYEIPIYSIYESDDTATVLLNNIHFVLDWGANDSSAGGSVRAILNDTDATELFSSSSSHYETNLNLFGVDIGNATKIIINASGYAGPGFYSGSYTWGDVSYLYIR